MTRKELIQQVVLRMDEVTPESGLNVIVDGFTDGADSNPLYQLVDGILDDAALEVYASAPIYRLPQTAFLGSDMTTETLDGSGSNTYCLHIKLGDTFLRLVAVNSKYFQRPIVELYPEQSAVAKRQYNRFLRGREAKPVGIITHYTFYGSQKARSIDCYSFKTTDQSSAITASFASLSSYVARPTIAATGNITFEPSLIPALEWLSAAKAFGARGDTAHMQICQQNAQELLV